MTRRHRLPTLTERRATLAKIDAAQRDMLPDNCGADMADITEARILEAQFLAEKASKPGPLAGRADYFLAGFALALLIVSITASLAKS